MADMVLPAHAGMIPGQPSAQNTQKSAPRTCGDDPKTLDDLEKQVGCSPHMRG